MKIALINFPVDNNYGGMLQRYALMKVLENMGHEVTHLNTRTLYPDPPSTVYLHRILSSIRHHRNFSEVFWERNKNKLVRNACSIVEPFYNKYIKHTRPICSDFDFMQYRDFDAYVVGSDQVWRRSMSGHFSYGSMFLNFLGKEKNQLRIAYGVSFGIVHNEMQEEDVKLVQELYPLFDSVSVREQSAIDILNDIDCKEPSPSVVLDPTLLLPAEQYMQLVSEAVTKPSEGNMFCYCLDVDDRKLEIMEEEARCKDLNPFSVSLGQVPVEQFLRSFMDSEMVVTDSYHGIVFSIIFKKIFRFIGNNRRGNERYESLKQLLGFNDSHCNWDVVYNNLDQARNYSLALLEKSLKRDI